MTNVLKPYLAEHLPESFELNEGEVILSLTGDGPFIPERYEYTTNMGLSFATARGMIECISDQIEDTYRLVLAGLVDEDEGDDDGA